MATTNDSANTIERYEHVDVPFKTLTLTCDAKTHKTSLIVDGKEFGHRCQSVHFSHDSESMPTLYTIKPVRLTPDNGQGARQPKREDYLEILDKQLQLLIEEQDKCENTKEKIKHTERICEHIYRLMCAIPDSSQDEL